MATTCTFTHTPSCHLFRHSRLGHKIQGVLCDGDSNEVVASTVVNCLKIDEGKTQKITVSLFFVFYQALSNSSLSRPFHRDHHHREGRLCPCSESPTDLWKSEKCYGVIDSPSDRLFMPGSLQDRLLQLSHFQSTISGTLYEQHEKDWVKAGVTLLVNVYNCGCLGKC